MMELVDVQGLGSCALRAWEFDSPYPHQHRVYKTQETEMIEMKKNNRKSIKESSTTIERIGDMKKDYRITE